MPRKSSSSGMKLTVFEKYQMQRSSPFAVGELKEFLIEISPSFTVKETSHSSIASSALYHHIQDQHIRADKKIDKV